MSESKEMKKLVKSIFEDCQLEEMDPDKPIKKKPGRKRKVIVFLGTENTHVVKVNGKLIEVKDCMNVLTNTPISKEIKYAIDREIEELMSSMG